VHIVVIGTIVIDTIEHPDGGTTESLGGIAHTVAVLSALVGSAHTIVPLCRAGNSCRRRITDWAERLAGVTLRAVDWIPDPQPCVHLSYPDAGRAGERIERLRHAPPPLGAEDVAAARGADLILVNCITGTDCTPRAMAALRDLGCRLFLDVHSLALGTAEDGTRFHRPRDDWDSWLGAVDVMQCNRAEAATICRLDVDEAGNAAVLAALARRMDDAGHPGAAAMPPTCLLTLGASGAVLVRRHRTGVMQVSVPAPEVDAVDPTGAGDAFGAGFACAWFQGASAEPATREAVRAGSAACTSPGSPDPETFLKTWSRLD
jgi:sugar/nucleoside kinase (ribokinase family)